MNEEEKIKNMLVYLGWSRWDGQLWEKDHSIFMWGDAVVIELQRLSDARRMQFECPDCGYKVGFEEFVQGEAR